MASLNSTDAMIAAAQTYGMLNRTFSDIPPLGTAATTTSGYVTARRFDKQFTFPSVGSGVTGGYLTYCRMYTNLQAGGQMMGIEYAMGTLTISGNVFADGVAMPASKMAGGTTITNPAAQMIFLVATTALTATTPTITITYTDQAGNTGNVATLTLPTSPAVGAAFFVNPHLAAGDTGIRDITGISTSGGTAGVLKVFGILPLHQDISLGLTSVGTLPLVIPTSMWLCEAADTIAIYDFGSNSTSATLVAHASFLPET